MNFENNIPFDPGFSQHLGNFYMNMEYVFETLSKIKNFNQKKFQYQRFFPSMSKDLNTYINFYIGCMLWAVYIKQFKNKEISENPALGQNYSDEEGLFPIRYIQDFIPKFEKGVKYFLNKDIKIEEEKLKILEIYTEFLQINKHFTNVKTSSDLLLPFGIKNPDYDLILKTIQTATESGNFDCLYKLKNLILDNAV